MNNSWVVWSTLQSRKKMEASVFYSSLPSQPNQTLARSRTPTLRLSIRSALSRTKKEQTVELLKVELKDCHFLAGINFKGITVIHFQELRRSLPDSVRLVVAKNTLFRKAIEGTQWDALQPCTKGMNAWLFVHSEEFASAIEPFRRFQREKKLPEATDFVGGVFEGQFYSSEEIRVLETLPGRTEIYAQMIRSMSSPAIGIVDLLRAPARQILSVLMAYVLKLGEAERNSGSGSVV